MNYLVIDADPNTLSQFGKYFRNHHVDYELFSSSEEALKNAIINHYDVIFTNLMFPEISSIELLYKLLHLKDHSNIVVMSELPEALDFIGDKFSYHLTNTLHKPFNYNDLDNIIEKIPEEHN